MNQLYAEELAERKRKTLFQPNLDPSGTLSSILIIKLHLDKPPHDFKPPSTLVKNMEL